MLELAKAKLVLLLAGGGSALAAGLVLGHTLYCGWGLTCPSPTVPGSGAREVRAVAQARPIQVSGQTVRPVTPGRSVPIDLRLTNPNTMALVATDLRVTLSTIDAPRARADRRCTRADFRIDQASRRLRVTLAPRKTTSLRATSIPRSRWPQVTMLDRSVNQDGCQGAQLSLRYALSGSEVRR